MDSVGNDMHDYLIVVRAVHFAATAILAGSLIFWTAVAEPILRSSEAATIVRFQTLRVAWISLAITVVSGVIWVLLQAASMSGLSLGDALTADVMSTVLNETQFGQVSEIRFVLAITLAACLAYDRLRRARWLALESALGLIAALVSLTVQGRNRYLLGTKHASTGGKLAHCRVQCYEAFHPYPKRVNQRSPQAAARGH
jgi:putative copper resistance protein D